MSWLTRSRTAAIGVLLAVVAAGCAPAAAPSLRAPAPTPSASDGGPPDPVGIPSARVGGPAKSTRVHFVPEEVTLPGGAHAAVEPARTVDGDLEVPENVQYGGWWDGSAYAGDPFGSTVIAGHVDSATEGIGYFARLLRVEVGDEITVRGPGHQLSYRVTSVQTVDKQALATDSEAFDQNSAHRLVLITCTGTYRRDQGGYDSNLVVVADPIGFASPSGDAPAEHDLHSS